jgi:hypothetical protein
MKAFYRIYCVNCRTELYRYTGDFVGKFQPGLFKPASSGIPAPANGAPMMCPNCGQRWYLLKENGAILVLTDQGIKPQSPQGKKRIYTYPREVIQNIESIFGNEKTNYEEPQFNAKSVSKDSGTRP